MASRSRTQIFMRYRSSLRTHSRGPRTTTELRDFKVHKNLLAAQSDDEGSQLDARVYCVPPAWVPLVDDMNRDISQIRIKVAELSALSTRALMPSFAETDEDELIAQTVAEVSTHFKECEKRLRTLVGARSQGTADEQSVRANIERRVAQQLQDLGAEFRRGHKAYLAKLKGQTIEEFRPDLSAGAPAAAGGGGFFDDEPEVSCADPRFSAAQTLQLVMAERMTEEREKSITQVAESVGELAEIFKEIQVLVIDQGTILDQIDYNIEQAADRVGNAVVELNKANDYQKKSRTMLCIYLLLLLCGFMVIILILKKSL